MIVRDPQDRADVCRYIVPNIPVPWCRQQESCFFNPAFFVRVWKRTANGFCSVRKILADCVVDIIYNRSRVSREESSEYHFFVSITVEAGASQRALKSFRTGQGNHPTVGGCLLARFWHTAECSERILDKGVVS